MRELRPNTTDISFSYELLAQSYRLDEHAYAVLLRLYALAASRQVWTMEAPQDGVLRNMDAKAWRHNFRATPARWRVIKEQIAPYFEIDGANWTVRYPEWFSIAGDRTLRPALGASLRRQILERDGYRCLYCGSQAGPFDVDHIVPVASGGSDHPENLACACAPCNRSKGAKSLEEWAR